MRNRNENERGGANRNLPASQQDKDAQRHRPQDPAGSQQSGQDRGDAGRQQPQDPKQGEREGGGSKGNQANWSPARNPTEREGVTPPAEDEDRDRGGRDRMQKP